MDDAKLIAALRCVASTPQPEHDCKSCPYFLLEKLTEEERIKLGAIYWETCDCDQVCLDAAARLEELTGGGR